MAKWENKTYHKRLRDASQFLKLGNPDVFPLDGTYTNAAGEIVGMPSSVVYEKMIALILTFCDPTKNPILVEMDGTEPKLDMWGKQIPIRDGEGKQQLNPEAGTRPWLQSRITFNSLVVAGASAPGPNFFTPKVPSTMTGDQEREIRWTLCNNLLAIAMNLRDYQYRTNPEGGVTNPKLPLAAGGLRNTGPTDEKVTLDAFLEWVEAGYGTWSKPKT